MPEINTLESEKVKIHKFVEKYAKTTGYQLNPDKEIVEFVIEGLARNKIKYGKQYCPCRIVTGNPQEDKQKICPCKWHKEEIALQGHCHCNLFFANKLTPFP